jgi:hypothetical protein
LKKKGEETKRGRGGGWRTTPYLLPSAYGREVSQGDRKDLTGRSELLSLTRERRIFVVNALKGGSLWKESVIYPFVIDRCKISKEANITTEISP